MCIFVFFDISIILKNSKFTKKKNKKHKGIFYKQGRIHGQYQSRTDGQGRKCVFSHFLNSITPTDQRTDRRTDEASYRVASPRLKMLGKWFLFTIGVAKFNSLFNIANQILKKMS